MIKNNSIVGLDFDGTVVKHRYPSIGEPVPDAVRVIKRLIREKECKIILHTMRGSRELNNAVGYLKKNGIDLYGENENPKQRGGPFRHSKKVWCDYYIDDSAIGCPLITPKGEKPFANWLELEKLIFEGEL